MVTGNRRWARCFEHCWEQIPAGRLDQLRLPRRVYPIHRNAQAVFGFPVVSVNGNGYPHPCYNHIPLRYLSN